MLFRVGGIYAPSNAAFTTAAFTLPASGGGAGSLWLNMDNRVRAARTLRRSVDALLAAPRGLSTGRWALAAQPAQGMAHLGGDMPSSFIMVALLPGAPISRLGREKCWVGPQYASC